MINLILFDRKECRIWQKNLLFHRKSLNIYNIRIKRIWFFIILGGHSKYDLVTDF